MSRIGKLPIELSKDVKVTLSNNVLKVEGPKATLERTIHSAVSVEIGTDAINVTRNDESVEAKAMHGLFRMLIANMVTGVTQGFTKILEVKGTGYKFEMRGDSIGFSLGFSHPVEMKLPKGVSAETNKNGNELTLTCADKELLGDFAAKIKKLRPVEPYKGKGIYYKGQVIRRKAGKAAGK
ncbi:MAG: 50S ribosomal protein L6 [bacterium]